MTFRLFRKLSRLLVSKLGTIEIEIVLPDGD
jgi:hypothetical protein